MSTSIHLIAAITAFVVLTVSFTVLAVFLRYRWASILFRLTIDLAWVNIRAQVVLLTNPAQNTLFVYWGLVFLYAVIFYIARPGGMGLALRGSKAKFGTYTRVLDRRLASGLRLVGFFSLLFFGQGEFIGKELSEPELIGQVRVDAQRNIGYDHYQQGALNVVYLYDSSKQQYTTIKADINLDNQVDVVLRLNELGSFDREIYTYTQKQRLIFYILAPLCFLALLGMRKKDNSFPGEPTERMMRKNMRNFIYNSAMQVVPRILLMIPFVSRGLTLAQLDEKRERYGLCLQNEKSATCDLLARDLEIERGQVLQEDTQKILGTYIQLYESCVNKNCTSNLLDIIEQAFAKWLATQQDIAITFAFEAKELANNIAADSFLFTLNSIPQLGNDILSLLSLNTIVHEQLTNFQVAGELSSEQRDALSAAILKSDHTRFYQSLMWLAEKSSYMSDNKLLTANFQSSNLSSTNLIHLRQIAHSVEQHQTFVALQDQTTLSLDDISLHLLTADTIRFLTENNPLFPPRYFVGKGLSKAGYNTLAYNIGYLSDQNARYMEQATAIMQRDLSDLQQEKAETLQSYKDIAQTNELSLRELAKLYSSSTLHVMQLKLQIWIRQIISYIDNSAWISRINDAHIDFLYDLGM